MIPWVVGKNRLIEPKFKIRHNEPSNMGIASGLIEGSCDSNSSYEAVSINNKETNLVCFLPNLTDPYILDQLKGHDYNSEAPRSDQEILGEAVPKLSTFFDEDNCIFTTGLNEGYWTYGYCFADKLIQFHEDLAFYDKTKIHKPEFPDFVYVLGRFNGSDSFPPMMTNQASDISKDLKYDQFEVVDDPVFTNDELSKPTKAIKQFLGNGEICDETQEPRTTEIYYRCDPYSDHKTHIYYVSEVRTCKYRVIMNVKGLCGIDEFTPKLEEKIIDIVCNQLSSEVEENPKRIDDLIEFSPVINNEFKFPQPRHLRIDLYDFDLTPGGNGFFWGRPKNCGTSTNLYDQRSIVIFNEDVTNTYEFIQRFSRMFSNSMEFKVSSPDPNSENGLATWYDTFIAWYEVYDLNGKFINIMKVKRQGNSEDKGISLQVVDPFSMVDQDGDAALSPTPDETRSLYHFEKFERYQGLTEKKKIDTDRVYYY